MSKHTPGKWRVSNNAVWKGEGFDAKCVCLVADNEEGKSNARLIARAPEMAEQLERCKQFIKGLTEPHTGNGNDLVDMIQEDAKDLLKELEDAE